MPRSLLMFDNIGGNIDWELLCLEIHDERVFRWNWWVMLIVKSSRLLSITVRRRLELDSSIYLVRFV